MSTILKSSLPHNLKERRECRLIILKILDRENVALAALLDHRYYRNLGFGMKCQLRLMIREEIKDG